MNEPGRPSGTRTDRTDVAVGLFLAGLGLLTLVVIIPLGVEMPPALRTPLTSPRLLPQIAAGAITLFGVVIAIQAMRGKGLPRTREDGSAPRGLLVVLAAIAGYFCLSEAIGAAAIACLVTLALLLLSGERRWPVLLFAGLILPFAAVTLLIRVGGVPLPTTFGRF